MPEVVAFKETLIIEGRNEYLLQNVGTDFQTPCPWENFHQHCPKVTLTLHFLTVT